MPTEFRDFDWYIPIESVPLVFELAGARRFSEGGRVVAKQSVAFILKKRRLRDPAAARTLLIRREL